MFWCDKLINGLASHQLINDSKTPSGRAHVGALRGPLIHDAIFRTLKANGITARYTFGIDDYDPVDEIPYGEKTHFEQYLGAPLCNVPPPVGSHASDMADHYASEFLNVLAELGVRPEIYRMRDVYRSGRFNKAIDTILRQSHVVRDIYRNVSGAVRESNWHPFNVICEQCGRIGTTTVTAYDGNDVTYTCLRDGVKWARGCGHAGKVSPFNGNGKLPWKLEWCAKWATFPITIEGAGQDHSTKGGSRDVASACIAAIFGHPPPLNCPYQFFLVDGAKMSSSKGIGVTARDMADFLPPDILRFLLIRPNPRHPVNFEPSETFINRLFNEFDRFHYKYHANGAVTPLEKRVYELSRAQEGPAHWLPDFQLLTALAQMPHLDASLELEKRKGAAFTDVERKQVAWRLRAAHYWINNYAADREKTRLHEQLPPSARELTATQRAFLAILATKLSRALWDGDALQVCIFDAARLTPIEQPSAFKAIYRVLLDRDDGPKAGNLVSFLERSFLIKRFTELAVDNIRFFLETGIETEHFERWLDQERERIVAVSAKVQLIVLEPDERGVRKPQENSIGFVECLASLTDGKTHCKRVMFCKVMSVWQNTAEDMCFLKTQARDWIDELAARLHITVDLVA
jgi:lysyl-tRNA synthetase, class I